MSKRKAPVRPATGQATQAQPPVTPQVGAVTSPVVAGATHDSFYNFQHKLGVGADNPLSSSTYGFNPVTRNRQLLEWIHRGSWLGGVAVDVVAQDMTRRGVEFLSEMNTGDISTLERRAIELRVWGAIRETVQWARLYGGCICIALVDGQDPRDPLDLATVGPGQFKGLMVLDRWMIEPSVEDLVDEYGPQLGLPRYYRVTQAAPAMRGKAVHYSRVMFRLTGVEMPYQQKLMENLWGISVLERLYDRMIAYDSASTGAAQLVYKSYLRTLSIEGMREIVAAGGAPLDGLTKYVDMMRRFQGIEGITMIDKKDEFQIQGTNAFSGLSDVLVQFGQQLSGALQIPLVRLFGQSPNGMNPTGESDLRTYYDHIASEQVVNLTDGVHKVYKMMAQSEGLNIPNDFKMGFKPLWELSDLDKSQIAKANTETVMMAVDAGLISERTALQELRHTARTTGVFTNISEADIDAASDVPIPPITEVMPHDPAQNPHAALDPGAQGRSQVPKPVAPGGQGGGLHHLGAEPHGGAPGQ